MRATADVLLRCTAGLFVVALLVQFFIAGMAALTRPEWWNYHLTWVSFFQWLVVPLPVFAWLAGPPRPVRVTLACIPFVQIALQYVLAHRALDGRLPIGLGLHAANAALMLVIVVALAANWPNGRIPSSDHT
jgi:hypothetical protein